MHKSSTNNYAIARFWDKCYALTKHYKLNDVNRRWYARYVERYINVHAGHKLIKHTSSDLTSYLNDIGRIPEITLLYFSQHVDALRILFCDHLNLTWAHEFAWDSFKGAANTLDPDHPAIARDATSLSSLPVSKPGLNQQTQDSYPELFQKFVSEVRVRPAVTG